MKKILLPSMPALLLLALLATFHLSCGGGGSGGDGTAPPSVYSVTFNWAPNHEHGVNSAGGGYRVSISGQPTIDVPYVSGLTAPTSTTASLPEGSYTVSVAAYAALDPQGGTTGNTSAPSQPITVNVP
jgi:hypothetical protein